MDISRRFFLGGSIALIAAQSFKPVNALNMPTIYGNGIKDDSAGFNALFNNEPVVFNKEQIAIENHDGAIIFKGNFKISKTIEITKRTKLEVQGYFNVDARELPEDEALIFYHPDKLFDPSVMDNRIMLSMSANRKVPLFQYNWKDPNFKLIDKPHYGKLESYVNPNGRIVKGNYTRS